ncbi:hypothetical protein D3C87_1651380 [compost metagenome]
MLVTKATIACNLFVTQATGWISRPTGKGIELLRFLIGGNRYVRTFNGQVVVVSRLIEQLDVQDLCAIFSRLGHL